MSFNKKYLKYKEKYQKLKNQIGGMFNVGDRVRVTGNKNIVVKNSLGLQNYSKVEGNIVKRNVAPNGRDIYTVETELGYALEINSHEHTITKLNTDLGRQEQRFAFAHAAPPPPNPPTVRFNMAPPPPPPQPRRKYHQYEVNSWVEVDGTPIKKGVIIKASEYNFDIPVYDIRIENIDPTDNIVLEKVSEFTIIKKLDSIAELIRLQQIRKLIDEAKERKKMDIARFGQSAAQGNSLFAEFGQSALEQQQQQALEQRALEQLALEQRQLGRVEFGQSATPLETSRRAKDTQLAATPVRIPGTNFEPLIKGIFKPNDTQSKFLRLEPSDYSEMKIDIIENNDPLDILSKDKNFLFIRSRSKEGWVKREHVETQVNIEELVKDKRYRHGLEIRQPIKVSAIQTLMLRARPSIWSEFTHVVVPGISLELVSDHEKFFKVKTEDGKEGFIKWNNIAEKERLPPHRSLREVTRKARINRTDGQAKFIKLREKPQLTSNFEPVQDLPNGTIVDILEGENWNIEWNSEWQYVRFSPDRDTDIRGWVRKIYLQYQ